MRFLFLHSNFPAQFRHLAVALAKDPQNEVYFGTARVEGELQNVRKVIYSTTREAHPETHHYVRPLENAVLQGQAVFRLTQKLKEKGFIPDIVYGHSGWGPAMFIKDAFPNARLLCYFEWFYRSHGSDVDFDPNNPPSADDEARVRIKNAPILIDLFTCDKGLSPTHWQKRQFPPEYQNKLTVMHDGVDTDFFCPQPGAKLILPEKQLDLSQAEEIITYVARGMEPYRGFPQFMEAIALLQNHRPQLHVVIVGEDRVAYGSTRSDGKTYKQYMLEKLTLDLERVHFTGLLPYAQYLKVIQASSLHVYLTYPFVLSWSMLEVLSTGCLLLASDTPPVHEVVEDGVNGFLVDFFDPKAIATRMAEILDRRDRYQSIRAQARETIVERYDLKTLLPRHIDWMMQEPAKEKPAIQISFEKDQTAASLRLGQALKSAQIPGISNF